MVEIEGLTVELYKKYKKRKLSDTQIGILHDRSLDTVNKWKRERGIKSELKPYAMPTKKGHIKEAIRITREGLAEGRSITSIRDELEMSKGTFIRFRHKYLPDTMGQPKTAFSVFSKEQTRIRKENGINLKTALSRLNSGYTKDEAVTMPVKKVGRNKETGRFVSGKRNIESDNGCNERERKTK